ncbi:MAG: hypothetical protein WBV71_04860 [Roseobacter sp.]
MQQRLWLTAVKMVAMNIPEQAVIDLLTAMLVTMRDADDAERAWLYTGRLDAMHRTKWQMVHTYEFKHRQWQGTKVSNPDDDYPVIKGF